MENTGLKPIEKPQFLSAPRIYIYLPNEAIVFVTVAMVARHRARTLVRDRSVHHELLSGQGLHGSFMQQQENIAFDEAVKDDALLLDWASNHMTWQDVTNHAQIHERKPGDVRWNYAKEWAKAAKVVIRP